jgi:hypothetical protein
MGDLRQFRRLAAAAGELAMKKAASTLDSRENSSRRKKSGRSQRSVRKEKVARRGKPEGFAAGVARGLRMAARSARRTARMYGTPIYLWENGRVVARKP